MLYRQFFLILLFVLIAVGRTDSADRDENTAKKKRVKVLQEEIARLKHDFFSIRPQKPYLVVNTSDNEVLLMSGDSLLRRGPCSSGSYILLKTQDNREWLFKTPRGAFKVNVKLKDPWWYKPDWAYLEEGLEIPSPISRLRYEPGVLGDFALGFGRGYLVHGTLYTRFLGMPVTHGCVRLGDEDMQIVYQTLTHGSKIYIY